jgi:hypothetical protein
LGAGCRRTAPGGTPTTRLNARVADGGLSVSQRVDGDMHAPAFDEVHHGLADELREARTYSRGGTATILPKRDARSGLRATTSRRRVLTLSLIEIDSRGER